MADRGGDWYSFNGANAVSNTARRMPAAMQSQLAGALTGLGGRAASRELLIPDDDDAPSTPLGAKMNRAGSRQSLFQELQARLKQQHGELSMDAAEDEQDEAAVQQAVQSVQSAQGYAVSTRPKDTGYLDVDVQPDRPPPQYAAVPAARDAGYMVPRDEDAANGYLAADQHTKVRGAPQYQQTPYAPAPGYLQAGPHAKAYPAPQYAAMDAPRRQPGVSSYEDLDDETGTYLGSGANIETINGAKVNPYYQQHADAESELNTNGEYMATPGADDAPGAEYTRLGPRASDSHVVVNLVPGQQGRTIADVPPEQVAQMLQSLDSSKLTVHQRFPDRLPMPGRQYFIPADSERRRITCVIPTYNEPCVALRRTLRSLHTQLGNLAKLGFDIFIVIIVDGWALASDTMKDYLRKIFPASNALASLGVRPWWEDLDAEGPPVETFIVQSVHPKTWRARGVEIEPDIMPGSVLNLSLMVKRDNRRKHNSLEWFLRGFAEEYMGEYAFTTDCGTLYEKTTISELAKHLDTFPNVAGCTGRQRVMTAKQQGERRRKEKKRNRSHLSSFPLRFLLF